jgi:hypothetical protein
MFMQNIIEICRFHRTVANCGLVTKCKVSNPTGFTATKGNVMRTYIFQIYWPVTLQLWRILLAVVTFFWVKVAKVRVPLNWRCDRAQRSGTKLLKGQVNGPIKNPNVAQFEILRHKYCSDQWVLLDTPRYTWEDNDRLCLQ